MLQVVIVILGIFIWIVVQISESFSNQKSKNENIKRQNQERKEKFGERMIDMSLTLEERNKDIIEIHLKKISTGYWRPYYIDNCVRDCINEIAIAEGAFHMAPGYAYLSKWSNSANLTPW